MKTHFKGARIIALTESYRSGQPILDASHALMEKAGESLPLYKLQSRTGNNTATVEVTEFNDEHAERVGIADHIVRLVGEGIQPHEIAILYRRNSEAFAFAYELEKRNIATSIESDQNTLHDPDIRRFLVLLRSLAHFGSDEAILNVLHLPFIRIEPLDVYKVLRRARVRTQSIADVMSSAAELRDSKLKDKDAVRAVWAMLKKFTQSGGSVPQTVSDLIEESGFLAYILRSPHASDLLEKLGALVRDIETLAAANPDYTMENLVDHIELLEEHGVAISKKHGRKQVDAVRLMTAHRAKGLEFQYVFVVNVADGVWGGKSERSLFNLPTGGTQNSDEDERRILYVALTRAKFGVILSHPRLKESGTETLPSRLLEDIDANLLVRATPIHNETRGESLAKPRARARRSHAEVFFVRELFIEQGLSVTALNNYLTCPWEYFYTNLLRVPRTPSKEMLFGTIMHAALKRFFDTRNRKPRTNLTHLLTYMNEAIERTPLSRSDRAELSTRGAEFFSTWYEQYHTTWPKKTRSEYKVTTEMKVDIRNAPSSEMQSIPLRLRGDLDRIDITRGSHVHVVDYKTGQPKTRNAIMGLTKSETGDYWRQLIFYKLLLAREGKYIFDSAELNFLQPDRKGMHHIEHFEVPDTDVENMEKEIIRVVNEIWKLEFWNSRCDSKECEWCGLRELMG
jgi:DNA helicase-2/ATP-dependent DNA helicase PcrA